MRNIISVRINLRARTARLTGRRKESSMTRRTKRSKVRRLRDSGRLTKRRFVRPETLEDFRTLSNRWQEIWSDVGQIVTKIRAGASLAEASRQFGRDPRAVQRLAAPALRKQRNRRWAAKKIDRLLRVLQIITSEGRQEIGIRDSRQASTVGEYWNAVERYTATGDTSELRKFWGKRVMDADGKRVALLTNLDVLNRLGSAGVLSFESLYARVA